MTLKHKQFGFVRVATAVPKLRVADCSYNAGEHVALMKQAQKEGVTVLVFPELSLTGYTCADLFDQDPLRQGALAALQTVKEASRADFDGLVLVGLPLEVDCQLFNCAAVLHRGRILGIVPKMFPPTYKEFYESRWFRSAASAHSKEVSVNGSGPIPFGTDILFAASDYDDLVVGVEICEDLWVPIPPSSIQALSGATILANLSASNELIGKAAYRRQLVANQAGRCMAAYVYASCGVHESTTDVVFGGHCLIGENGGLVAESKRFDRSGYLTVADIDLDRLRVDRVRTNSFGDSLLNLGIKPDFRRIEFSLRGPAAPVKLSREVEAHPFVPRGTERLAERCQEIFNIQVAGLAKRLEHVNPKHVTEGVSGGSDSTLALLVLCKTFDKLGWDRKRIHGYAMDGFGTTSRTKDNAQALMQELGITMKRHDIRSECIDEMRKEGHKPFGIDLDALRKQAVGKYHELVRAAKADTVIPELADIEVELFMELLKQLPEGAQDLTFENVQARMRTLVLMNAGFTIGTGDLSELALGWCTYNADHMSGYNPNASIPKTLVKFLIRWAAENEFDGEARRILMDICATEISPELLPTGADGKIKQKTESVVGPYELHDFFMYYVLRFGSAPEKILYLAQQAKFNQQYTIDELKKWLRVFITRFFDNQFKRSCLPDGPKVGSISLSPRGDWRMPSDAKPALWLEWVKQSK